MTMASSPQPRPRTRFLKLRVVGVAIAVLAMLLYLNAIQADDERAAALYSSDILIPTIDLVLSEQRQEAASNALYEYLLLVASGFGVLSAAWGPPLIRRLTRGMLYTSSPPAWPTS